MVILCGSVFWALLPYSVLVILKFQNSSYQTVRLICKWWPLQKDFVYTKALKELSRAIIVSDTIHQYAALQNPTCSNINTAKVPCPNHDGTWSFMTYFLWALVNR